MTELDKLIDKLIPYPADYQHRNGFNNEPLIDQLNNEDRVLVEIGLIEKLIEYPDFGFLLFAKIKKY